MAMDPITKAALIQTGGSLVSNFLGGKSAKVSGKDYAEAAYRTIGGKVQAAKRFGLHPLFALGQSTPGPAQAIPGQSNLGSFAKDAAAIAAGAIQDKAIQSAQTDLIKAQTENWQLRNEELRKANAGVNAPAIPSPAYIPPRNYPKFDTMAGSKRTSEASRQDITETFGAIMDEWWHNPNQRPRIEREFRENFSNLPGVRNYLEWLGNRRLDLQDAWDWYHRMQEPAYRRNK